MYLATDTQLQSKHRCFPVHSRLCRHSCKSVAWLHGKFPLTRPLVKPYIDRRVKLSILQRIGSLYSDASMQCSEIIVP